MPLETLSVDQIQRIEARMRPGSLSESGFLAPHESLAQVVQRDLETLRELGLTPDHIADRLESIIGAACQLEATREAGGFANPHSLSRQVCHECGWQSPLAEVAGLG